MPIPLTLAPIRRSTAVRILKMGFSPFLILATDSVIIIALNAVLQHFGGPEYGDTLITCATIVQSYMLLITSPMLGITGGSQPLISFNMGAGKVERIRKIVLCVLLLCIGFTTFMFLLSRFVPQYFVRIFTQNPEYASLSVWGIQVFTLGVIPLSFQYVFVDALTAMSLTKLSLFYPCCGKASILQRPVCFPSFSLQGCAFTRNPSQTRFASSLPVLPSS